MFFRVLFERDDKLWQYADLFQDYKMELLTDTIKKREKKSYWRFLKLIMFSFLSKR